jgi:hypothetical protein
MNIPVSNISQINKKYRNIALTFIFRLLYFMENQVPTSNFQYDQGNPTFGEKNPEITFVKAKS